jgi:hypothetical protein
MKRKWGFHDLHSFEDFVGFVKLCAPDEFPIDDFLAPDEQMTLARAYEGLCYGMELTEKEVGPLPVLNTCRELIDTAFVHYRAGRIREGFFTLQDAQKLIDALPSQ